MLRGTIRLDLGYGLETAHKPTAMEAARRGNTLVMVRVHGVRPSKWAELWMTSNLQPIMDRHVMSLAQLFDGQLLREDADIPSHTYALCFGGAAQGVRFSMGKVVTSLYPFIVGVSFS